MVLKLIDTETNKEQIIENEKIKQLYNQSPEDFMKYIDFSCYLLNSVIPVIHNDKLDLLIDTFITGGNSSKNGKIGELFASEHFTKCCPNIVYIDTSKIPKSGDAILEIKNHKIGKIMIDYKNYVTPVSSEEVHKLIKDMETQNIDYGLFISYHSKVSRKKYIDYEIHNGKLIVFLTCCEMNFLMIQMAIEYLLRLYECNTLLLSNQSSQLIQNQTLTEFQNVYEQLFVINQTHSQHINSIKECMEKNTKLFTKLLSDAIQTKTSINSMLYKLDDQLNELHKDSELLIDSYDQLNYHINRVVDKDKERIYGKQLLDIANELQLTANYCEKDTSIHFHNKGKLQLFKHKLIMIFYNSSNEICYNSDYETVKNNNYYITLSDNRNIWSIIHKRFISVN